MDRYRKMCLPSKLPMTHNSDRLGFYRYWKHLQMSLLALPECNFLVPPKAYPLKCLPFRVTQVSAKACTSLALANGLSFPVATLAKSGKMAPVMAGSLLLGGATYSVREYLQVAAIIGGTAIVSLGK